MSDTQPAFDLSPQSLQALARQSTPARLLVDRAGGSYLTETHLQLRADHAAARDAVQTELELADLGSELVDKHRLFLVQTTATTKAEFLLRPDLGRKLSGETREQIGRQCGIGPLTLALSPEDGGEGTGAKPGLQTKANPSLQIVIGDGLSATAVKTQVPGLLPLLIESARKAGWSVGQPFVIRYCRVGVMNDIGELLDPDVVVLLIGERPGLATAESLSAYLAYRPRAGQTDAQRNLISNIHARGVSHEAAVVRVLDLAAQMRDRRISGVEIKERLPERGITVERTGIADV